MRIAFAQTLANLANKDPRIFLLTGDLGYLALDAYIERHPKRFLNVGVAEQNMVGIATGMAEAGFIPFIYSIVPFATLRGYEFIRNGPILHQLPVRIIGVGGGVEYGFNGVTHHGLEDVAVMRSQPSLTVITPADGKQTETALLKTWDLPGPVYYRLGKNDKVSIDGLEGRFKLGQAHLIRSGQDALLISMGAITTEAVKAASLLETKGVSASILVVSSINPPPLMDLEILLPQFSHVFSLESHYTQGGLSSLVSEVIARNGFSCRLVSCGVDRFPHNLSGSQQYLEKHFKISGETFAQTVIDTLRNIQPEPERAPIGV